MKNHLTAANIINGLGVIVIIYLSVVLLTTVKRNYDLNRQISSLKSSLVSLQDQRDELSYKIAYYKTDSYQDKAARSQLVLQLPGENVVILPTHKDGAYVPPAKAADHRSNFQQWLDFLLGRA